MQRKLSNEEYFKRKNFLNKINSIRSHIKRNMDTTELMDVKIITRGVLNKIKDDKCRLYMFYRYYDCLDEETIKYKMNISTRTCQRLNSQGIFSIKI